MNFRAGLRTMIGASEPAAPAPRSPIDDFWYESAPTRSGPIRVAADTVIQIPEVYDTLSVLMQSVAMLPLPIYRRLDDGGKRRETRHPLADILHHRPNATQTAYEFRAQMTWDLLLHRNAFAEIKDGPRGPIDSLTRLDPERIDVQFKTQADGSVDHVYDYHQDDGRKRRLLPEQVFHLRAPPLISNNLLGRSLIQDGRRTFARALAIQEYVTEHFENDATPTSVITTAAPFKTDEQAATFRTRWAKIFRDARNKGLPAVLDGTTSFNVVQKDHAKAQVMEAYKEVALQCIRWWRMPPHKVGMLDKATFSNIEQQALEFVTDTLMPWLVAWEQAISRDLILGKDVFFAEHNVGGLLRGDLKSRYEAYAIARNWGWLSVNDIRSLENQNPIAEGDVYLQPLNMVPAGTQYAERAAFAAYVDRERALTEAIEQYRGPRLIAQSASAPPTAAARCLAGVDDVEVDADAAPPAADANQEPAP